MEFIKKYRTFSIWLGIFILAVFVLNINHLNQQGVYQNLFREISENILSGSGYTCGEFDYKPAFYPIWGYTGLLVIDTFFGSTNFIVLLVQFVLCFSAVTLFYRFFEIEPKHYHYGFILPFVALCSVKWPDAIVGCLLIFFGFYFNNYLKNTKKKDLLIAALSLGLIANLRSEYIYLPLIIMAITLIPKLKKIRKNLILRSLVVFGLALILLLPWSFRSYFLTGEHRLSASNGWAVMYISLGQLPGNPWNLAPVDKTSFDFTEKYKKHPYSPDGDKLLKSEFIKLVSANPLAFVKKCGFNLSKFFTGGVYTGEFANSVINDTRRMEIDQKINSASGLSSKISSFGELSLSEIISISIEKLIQFVFVLVFLVLLILFFLSIRKNSSIDNLKMPLLIALSVIIYKILIAAGIQYEYRHVNAIYLFVLGPALIEVEKYLENRKLKSNN